MAIAEPLKDSAALILDALRDRKLSDEFLQEAARLLDTLQRLRGPSLWERIFPVSHASSGADASNVVLTSGFGWSGSSAVGDFLRDHEHVKEVFGRYEMPWFTGLRKSHVVGARNLCRAQPRERLAALSRFVLTSLLGCAGVLEGVAGSQRSVACQGLLLDFDGRKELAVAMETARRLVEIIARSQPSRTPELVGELFATLIRLARRAPGYCLFDNSIKAHKLDDLQFLPGARIIVVSRDPRDEFVARSLESGRRKLQVEDYVRRFIRVHRSMARKKKHVSEHQLLEVRFEDFVLDESCRKNMLDWLSLDANMQPRRFRAEVSAANVGIHKRWENRKDIEFVSRRLREYLHPSSD